MCEPHDQAYQCDRENRRISDSKVVLKRRDDNNSGNGDCYNRGLGLSLEDLEYFENAPHKL